MRMITAHELTTQPDNPLEHAFLPTVPQLPFTNKLFGVSQHVPSLPLIALNRITYGPRPGDIEAFNALGATDQDRLFAFIDQQLDPSSHLNNQEFEGRLAEANFSHLEKAGPELWQILSQRKKHRAKTEALRELERLLFIRAVYSERQLFELLAEFWHNHFNVFAWSKPEIAAAFIHFDRGVIRRHMLGNFKELLTAVAQSPAMLLYQENQHNTVRKPNQTLARTLFDCHTLGRENDLGLMRQSTVPRDSAGWPIGYVDEDVKQTAACLTGWQVDLDGSMDKPIGQFHYQPQIHEPGAKFVLGHPILSNTLPLLDGYEVLARLADHPSTARHLAKKLCRRFISDFPPQTIIESATAVFIEQKDAPDQLTQVVRHILRSLEFQTTWGEKVKRPFESIVSTLRATQADFTIKMDDVDSNSFMWRYGQLGQAPFACHAPDGYPDTSEEWQNNPSLIMRWRMINWLIEKKDAQGHFRLDILAQTNAEGRSATDLIDFWLDRLLGYSMQTEDRARIIEFMANGDSPFLPLDLADTAVQNRLRAAVGLILNSPQFQLR